MTFRGLRPLRQSASGPVRSRLIAVLTVLGVSLAFGAGPASGDDIDDRRAAAERKQQAIERNQESLEHDLEETDAELASAFLELQVIEGRLPVAEAELAAAQAEVERTQREADLLEQRLTDAQSQETAIKEEIAQGSQQTDAAQAAIAELARQAYRGEGQISSMGVVTGAESAEQFIEDYSVTSTAARSQASNLADLREAGSLATNRDARLIAVRDSVDDLKALADQNLAEARTAQQSAVDRKAEIESLVAEQKAKQGAIESRRAQATAQLAQAETDQAALTAELEQIVADQRARDAAKPAPRASSGSGGSGAGSGSSDGGNSGGGGSSGGGGGTTASSRALGYPTAVPYVTSSYGYRMHPVLGYQRLHAGTDFRARCGTPILASAGGTVQFARTMGNGTKQVVIDHGWSNGSSVMTGYLHLQSWSVSPGQQVSKGQVIGLSGNTGISTACHLHFEVYVNGKTVDPMSML